MGLKGEGTLHEGREIKQGLISTGRYASKCILIPTQGVLRLSKQGQGREIGCSAEKNAIPNNFEGLHQKSLKSCEPYWALRSPQLNVASSPDPFG